MSDAFVVLTHLLSPRIERLIERAREDLPDHAVLVVGGFAEGAAIPEPFRRREGFHAFGPAALTRPDWPLKGLKPGRGLTGGAADLPVLALARERPDLERIWVFEGDVEFTGPLSDLVGAFDASPADLLATSIRRPPRPNWAHGAAAVRPPGWAVAGEEATAFLPAHRSSRALRAAIERFYAEGGDGHHEWVWPFCALAEGLTLEDIGGDGPFVWEGNRDRFYTSSPGLTGLHPGSFRYRPVMIRAGRRRGTLWHPVKDWLTPEEAGEGGGEPWPGRRRRPQRPLEDA